jgi:hypothetical protein
LAAGVTTRHSSVVALAVRASGRAGAIRTLGPLIVMTFVLAACGVGAAPASLTPDSPAPSASVSPAIAGTAEQIRASLGARGLQLSVPQVPFRPAESPVLAAAPRAVYQVKLPDDQDHGFFAVYELPDSPAATAAAREQVAYVESGPGRVQFPADARFVLRQLGSTLVFYWWAPSSTTDQRAPEIAAAIGSVGQGFAIRP